MILLPIWALWKMHKEKKKFDKNCKDAWHKYVFRTREDAASITWKDLMNGVHIDPNLLPSRKPKKKKKNPYTSWWKKKKKTPYTKIRELEEMAIDRGGKSVGGKKRGSLF